MEQTWKKRQEIEQAKDEKGAEHGKRRPAGWPNPLPQQRGTGEPEPHQEPGIGIGRTVGHEAPRFHAGAGPTSESQGGMVSSDSISS